MKDNYKINKAQKQAHQHFLAGYEAFVLNLKFSPAMNEGDYSGYFWAGFKMAELVHKKSKNDSKVWGYDEPYVDFEWRYKNG